jgi:hypothetical protein
MVYHCHYFKFFMSFKGGWFLFLIVKKFTLSTIKWHQWLGHLFVNVINEKKFGLRINDQINDLLLFESCLAKKNIDLKNKLKVNWKSINYWCLLKSFLQNLEKIKLTWNLSYSFLQKKFKWWKIKNLWIYLSQNNTHKK